MKAEIIAIGTELLLGQIVDTNSAYIAQQLTTVGLDLHFKATVGDNLERLKTTLQTALNRSDFIITTGGIGPTLDDVTREAVAEVLGRPLVFQQHLHDQINDFFRRLGRAMSPNNRKQAYIPEGAIPSRTRWAQLRASLLSRTAKRSLPFPACLMRCATLWGTASCLICGKNWGFTR